MASVRVRRLCLCVLASAIGVATPACPTPDFGPSEMLYDTFVAGSTFTVVGGAEQSGLRVGNDAAPGEGVVAFVVFDMGYLRSYDIAHEANVALTQTAIQGAPFADGATVVVDVLFEYTYSDYEQGAISPSELVAADAYMPQVGVLSRGPAPGERILDVAELLSDGRYLGTLVLRLRCDPPDDPNDTQDSVDFVALGQAGDPPRFDVSYQIAGH